MSIGSFALSAGRIRSRRAAPFAAKPGFFSCFTKKNDNDRIPIGVFCTESTEGGSVYGKSVSAVTGADSLRIKQARKRAGTGGERKNGRAADGGEV